jgi:hypothetical protein
VTGGMSETWPGESPENFGCLFASKGFDVIGTDLNSAFVDAINHH